MARKRRDGQTIAEGYKPTDTAARAKAERGERGSESIAERGSAGVRRARERGAGADGHAARTGGMGGKPTTQAAGRPPARGPLAQRPSPQSLVGCEVFNASGRGVWGRGEVVAVIPAGVMPYYFCRRAGLRQLFRRDTCASFSPRFIVRGDDGELHAPERVSWRMK